MLMQQELMLYNGILAYLLVILSSLEVALN